MGISAPYVGIHGTPDASSIGYSASHGCVRMRIADAEWLFRRVEVGTPVFIVSQLAMASRARLVAQGVAIGLVVLLFVLLAWSLLHDEGGDLAEAAARGERPQAPDFTLERLDEAGELQLSSLRGKAVVLNVWASWCVPCKDEAPYLEQIWRENRDRDLVVLGLDAKDFRGDARGLHRAGST